MIVQSGGESDLIHLEIWIEWWGLTLSSYHSDKV